MKVALVVDDEPTILHLLEITLRTSYEVHTALTGEEGFKLIEQHKPDIILLDVYLGPSKTHLTGPEFLAVIKSSPALHHIPVIILSGYASREEISLLLEAGASTFVAKPYSPIRLLELVGKVLRESEEVG